MGAQSWSNLKFSALGVKTCIRRIKGNPGDVTLTTELALKKTHRIDLILAAPTLFFEDGFPESEGPKVF